VRYAATEIAPAKSARARGAYLRVSFKNTRETAQAINGWKLERALTFLENVRTKTEAVPMRGYAGSTGRTAQGKQFGVSKARWPVKSADFLLGLLRPAACSCEVTCPVLPCCRTLSQALWSRRMMAVVIFMNNYITSAAAYFLRKPELILASKSVQLKHAVISTNMYTVWLAGHHRDRHHDP
ncbi:hypothetical protein BN1723_006614, partial [Verticillium longisporum]